MSRRLPELQIKVKAWVEARGETLLGSGRGALLKAIEEHGSISAAARELGLSYATAWNRIASMNRAAGADLVARQTGGRGGGGAKLTPAGHAALEAFALLRERMAEFRERTGRDLIRILRGGRR